MVFLCIISLSLPFLIIPIRYHYPTYTFPLVVTFLTLLHTPFSSVYTPHDSVHIPLLSESVPGYSRGLSDPYSAGVTPFSVGVPLRTPEHVPVAPRGPTRLSSMFPLAPRALAVYIESVERWGFLRFVLLGFPLR